MASGREIRNLVLVGKTGNGKSATGNTILGLAPPGRTGKNQGFRSGMSLSGVTKTSQMKQASIRNQIINVIDTPGLFDASATLETVSKEIVKCVTMAKEGVHAFIGVVSTWNRFTEEEAKAFQVLQRLFGPKTLDYMIIVFTLSSYDDGYEDIETFKNEYLSKAPASLQEIVEKCGDRILLVNNLTKNAQKKEELAVELMSFVNQIVGDNHEQPYSNEYFLKMQEMDRKRIEAERKMEELKKQRKGSELQSLQNQKSKEFQEFEKQLINKIKLELMRMTNSYHIPADCCSIL